MVQIFSNHRISMRDFVAEEASASYPLKRIVFSQSEDIFKNQILLFSSFNSGFNAEVSNM